MAFSLFRPDDFPSCRPGVLGAVVLTALFIAVASSACGAVEESGFGTNPVTPPPGVGGDAKAGDDGGKFESDGGTPAPSTYLGNALCGVKSDESERCFPDDGIGASTTAGAGCQVIRSDGGAGEDDSGDSGVPSIVSADGCRLQRATDEVVTPSCNEADIRGTDGVSCASGSDCAPGFDCIPSEKGSVCRHYCCAGTCEGQTSQNGGLTFCDVRTLVDTRAPAPVCVPLKRCKLMTAGACGNDETCGIVTETGETGCVSIGTAEEGASCEETHCGAGLTCLGQMGNRRCYELCQVSDPRSCGADQVCKTSTLFKDSQFGVCSSGS